MASGQMGKAAREPVKEESLLAGMAGRQVTKQRKTWEV